LKVFEYDAILVQTMLVPKMNALGLLD